MNTLDSVFKITMVHEGSIAGQQAADLLTRLRAELQTQLGMDLNAWEVCHHVWPFEWLQHHKPWKQALAEAADADMIVVSTGGNTELPACIRSWLEQVLARIKDGPVALVALLDGRRENAAASPPARYLRQLAEQRGADYFCNLDFQPPRVQPASEPVPSSFEEDSMFLQEAPTGDSAQGAWGINE
jgi:hypothetical protein